VNRERDELGVCGTGRNAVVASAAPHYGEERPLVGRGGSGTIFFSGCNLHCVFCQNCEISGASVGRSADANGLARIMLELESRGCENINLVTPSHVVPQIVEALVAAMVAGLSIPIVYNSSGYDGLESLRLLDGLVDIYMPDFKFWYNEGSDYLPGVHDYAEVAEPSVREMHRQVGDLQIVGGVAVGGLLVRHLVMPRQAADTASIMRFLASLSRDTYVNVMGQYRPHHRARRDPVIGAPVSAAEHAAAVQAARAAGLRRIET
jgi:putative pyruvate formate lyase activating enzyme